MKTESEGFDKPRKRRKKRGKNWIWVSGLTIGIVVFFAVAAFVTMYIMHTVNLNRRAAAVERVFQEALVDGDLIAAYEKATPEFKRAYSKSDLLQLRQKLPELFDRSFWIPSSFVRTVYADGTQISIEITLTNKDLAQPRIYTREDPDEKLRLLGIEPGWDKVVPTETKEKLKDASTILITNKK